MVLPTSSPSFGASSFEVKDDNIITSLLKRLNPTHCLWGDVMESIDQSKDPKEESVELQNTMPRLLRRIDRKGGSALDVSETKLVALKQLYDLTGIKSNRYVYDALLYCIV